MSTRLYAKVFEVDQAEKGSPLQTKINSYTKDKPITKVHSFEVTHSTREPKKDSEEKEPVAVTRAIMLADHDIDEGATAERVYAKVVERSPVTSELQTKINSWSKTASDNGCTILEAVTIAASDGQTAEAVILYLDPRKKGSDEDAGEAAARPASAEEVAAPTNGTAPEPAAEEAPAAPAAEAPVEAAAAPA
jgi:hypothetical protein